MVAEFTFNCQPLCNVAALPSGYGFRRSPGGTNDAVTNPNRRAFTRSEQLPADP
jgi:hypothetical protein